MPCLRYFTIKQQVLYVGAIALGNHPVPVKLPTLLFLKESKASFLESEHDDYSFRFLKKTECPHNLMVPKQGDAMAEMPASLIAST